LAVPIANSDLALQQEFPYFWAGLEGVFYSLAIWRKFVLSIFKT